MLEMQAFMAWDRPRISQGMSPDGNMKIRFGALPHDYFSAPKLCVTGCLLRTNLAVGLGVGFRDVLLRQIDRRFSKHSQLSPLLKLSIHQQFTVITTSKKIDVPKNVWPMVPYVPGTVCPAACLFLTEQIWWPKIVSCSLQLDISHFCRMMDVHSSYSPMNTLNSFFLEITYRGNLCIFLVTSPEVCY